MITLYAENGGRFISRGKGRHISRVIQSWELIFVLSGTLGMFADDRTFRVKTNECLLLKPGVPHGGTGDYLSDLSFFWIHFHPADTQALECLNRSGQHFATPDASRLSDYFQLFLSVQENPCDDREALNSLVSLILHEAMKPVVRLQPETEKKIPLLAQKTERLLTLRFREPLSTSLLAKELNCTGDYLGRVFRRSFGVTLTEQLNSIRIRHAARLLLNRSLSVSQIAYETGFNDIAYFRRRFFQEFAMTPLQYRGLKSPEHVNTE